MQTRIELPIFIEELKQEKRKLVFIHNSQGVKMRRYIAFQGVRKLIRIIKSLENTKKNKNIFFHLHTRLKKETLKIFTYCRIMTKIEPNLELYVALLAISARINILCRLFKINNN